MNVFMPYPDVVASIKCLDNKRLGNQIYREALTLIRGGWRFHPAARIWVNHKYALAQYALAGLDELDRRGFHYPHHRLTFRAYLQGENTGLPPIVVTPAFCRSHQSNLIRKDAQWYGPLFPGVPNDLPYVWS